LGYRYRKRYKFAVPLVSSVSDQTASVMALTALCFLGLLAFSQGKTQIDHSFNVNDQAFACTTLISQFSEKYLIVRRKPLFVTSR